MTDAPSSLVVKSQIYFQRFTINEVRQNKCDDNHVIDWCYAIQKTYNIYLKLNGLPTVNSEDRHELAKKLGKTYYPSMPIITRAHIQLAEDIIRNTPHNGATTPMSTQNQLYITKDKEYVIRIGTNSSNEAVVEEKSTGRIFAVKPDTLEKVLPYSVSVRFNNYSQPYHYLADKNTVAVGDVLFMKDLTGFAHITDIDTKNEGATTKLTETFLGVVAIKAF